MSGWWADGGKQQVDGAAGHQFHEFAVRRPRGIEGPDVTAVAKHRHTVGKGADFAHAVRDVDQPDILALQARDQLEQPPGLAFGQRGGWLVEDQKTDAAEKRFGDLGHLLMRAGQIVDPLRGIEVEAELVDQRPGPLAHLACAQDAAAGDFAAKEQVLFHGEARDQRELLEHRTDADLARPLRRQMLDLLAAELERAFVGWKRTGYDVDQGRLAGAVLAEQDVKFAGTHIEVDAVECTDAGESLRYPPQLKQGLGRPRVDLDVHPLLREP
ncbi:hypothetical protein ACVWY2_008041 [Bradyrhizobium sp. JR6.1]